MTRDKAWLMHARTFIPAMGLAAVAGLGLSLAAAPASGQYALGDGRALDANQRVGSGGANRRQSPISADIALRNAVVTGNVAGGRHFRGDVGYEGVFDFRGESAEDTLFDFRRNSYYSGLAARGIRGIDDVRSQLGLTTNANSFGLTGNTALRRPTAGAFAAEATGQIRSGDTAPALDLFPRLDGTLRSTGGFRLREIDRPQLLSRRVTESGAVLITTASPLGGVRELPIDNSMLYGPVEAFGPIDASDLTSRRTYRSFDTTDAADPTAVDTLLEQAEQERQRDEAMTGALEQFGSGRPGTPRGDGMDADAEGDATARLGENQSEGLRIDSQRASERVDGRVSPRPLGHRAVLENMRRSAEDAGLLSQLRRPDGTVPGEDDEQPAGRDVDRILEDISEALRRGQTPTFDSEGNVIILDEFEAEGRGADDGRERDADGDAERDDAASADAEPSMVAPGEEDDEGPNPATIATFLRGGQTDVEELTADLENVDRTVLRHMAQGERWLEEGRWFDAEERFTAALSIEPGLAPARIGRIHAQIGAGLYASAALNLRQMLRDFPEFASAKYADRLLPREERLQTIRDQLIERMGRSEVISRDAGLLLAFLGYQTDRPQDVARGFERLRAVEAELELAPDPLDALLYEVWQSD
jgi:hypothetical protein